MRLLGAWAFVILAFWFLGMAWEFCGEEKKKTVEGQP